MGVQKNWTVKKRGTAVMITTARSQEKASSREGL